MKCVWTQKVSLLIDGELPRAEAHEAARHLDLCGDCQSAREDFLLLRRQLADYPLELDAFARQRALKRILAAGNNESGLENGTSAPMRRRASLAGVFGMPRLSPASLAALLLLVVGVAAVIVSLMNSRRTPVEVVKNVPTHANDSSNNSSAATSIMPPHAPDDSKAGTNKLDGVEQLAANNQRRAGAKASKGESGSAAQGRGANVPRGANVRRVESAGGMIPKRPRTSATFSKPQVDARVAGAERNDVEAFDGDAGDASNSVATQREVEVAEEATRPHAAGESKTARHVEQAQLLLRSFRNARPAEAGRRASADLVYEKQRSRKLLYENIVLRREAANRGNLPVESLLDSLEPILLDIANLPDKPAPADLREINERMRRKNLVAMLQISAVESASARAY